MVPWKNEKPAVTLPVLLGVIAALMAFIAAIVYINFAPRPADTRRRDVSTEEKQQVTQQTAWLKQKAQETGGDWQKLSPQDQQQLKMIAKEEFATILPFYAKSK